MTRVEQIETHADVVAANREAPRVTTATDTYTDPSDPHHLGSVGTKLPCQTPTRLTPGSDETDNGLLGSSESHPIVFFSGTYAVALERPSYPPTGPALELADR